MEHVYHCNIIEPESRGRHGEDGQFCSTIFHKGDVQHSLLAQFSLVWEKRKNSLSGENCAKVGMFIVEKPSLFPCGNFSNIHGFMCILSMYRGLAPYNISKLDKVVLVNLIRTEMGEPYDYVLHVEGSYSDLLDLSSLCCRPRICWRSRASLRDRMGVGAMQFDRPFEPCITDFRLLDPKTGSGGIVFRSRSRQSRLPVHRDFLKDRDKF